MAEFGAVVVGEVVQRSSRSSRIPRRSIRRGREVEDEVAGVKVAIVVEEFEEVEVVGSGTVE